MPYRWSAIAADKTFEITDQRIGTQFQLALELEDVKTRAATLARSNFSCKDIAVVVYNDDEIETLAQNSQRQEEGSCHLQLPLLRDRFQLSRIELLWQSNHIRSEAGLWEAADPVEGKFRLLHS